MMDDINWNKIIYIDDEKKLIYFDQKTYKLPEAILNLYSDRVRHLDLSYNKLSSFASLELFNNLEELVLDNNYLNDEVIFPAQLDRIKLLSLNNNKFENLDLLLTKLSLCFPNLEYLSLLGNPACPSHLLSLKYSEYDYLKYRLYIIRYLPRLRILDAQRVKKMERDFVRCQQNQEYETDDSDSRRGSSLKHFYVNLSSRLGVRSKDPPVYHPLPESIREAGDHRGAYGKCRYRYIGAQSEGNRFILNTDL
ncbi:leucine-rich melanocyte differentiation-associated protein [Topomyia yanbarensis]|uniref:leucine-rich melanocyte differentiation-associated protein n=1 Tax=Topomyia yanbarensis TaxID=2498891 RepID=UPI00273B3BD3|nr:leucine-rich melanocyte differentiation-associated protein [Topomyia yanbarensis]XP_058813368.1 leucine-rich melanocyte differentiation-associated protein [Topomyia yanbarensis]XP_058813369.1 leucine-rich melanocyte differentiation-associated protein [Topomyia yanbarensis]XP_058813370.1 leucine-rich melanocyte differentiation-associated protein [Topomyia yanbarensis]